MMKYVVSLFELNFYKKVEEIYEELLDNTECTSLPENRSHMDKSNQMDQMYYQKERTSQMPNKKDINLDQTTDIEDQYDFKKGTACF